MLLSSVVSVQSDVDVLDRTWMCSFGQPGMSDLDILEGERGITRLKQVTALTTVDLE